MGHGEVGRESVVFPWEEPFTVGVPGVYAAIYQNLSTWGRYAVFWWFTFF